MRLRALEVGKEIKIIGKVIGIRNFGKLVFVDLRYDNKKIQTIWTKKPDVTPESIIEVNGEVTHRQQDRVTKGEYGHLELVVSDHRVISKSAILPFPINSKISRELEMKERLLYLRSDSMQAMMRQRSEFFFFLRSLMRDFGFTEVQTPLLTGSTPEGAKDYLVLSTNRNRKQLEGKKDVEKLKFYALPQSPQIFKQLTVVSGLNKYFQMAPCFRDEDSRADRLVGEFYQLDLEMAYVTNVDQVLDLLDTIVRKTVEKFNPKPIVFRRMTHEEAIRDYGCDKPDLRRPKIEDHSKEFTNCECKIFRDAISQGGFVKSIKTTMQIGQNIIEKSKDLKIGYIYKKAGKLKGTLAKFLDEKLVQDGEMRFFSAGSFAKTTKSLAKLSSYLPVDESNYSLVFVTDFPMFEWLEEEERWDFGHNPFSRSEGNDPKNMQSLQYDVVFNGFELASGSLRETRPEVLERNFKLAGYAADEVRRRFCLFDAFQYGVPPHGGAAFGLERFMMCIFEKKLTDVVIFPLNSNGQCPITHAPANIDLREFL
jgi:aspartyl-tRNA synthetase